MIAPRGTMMTGVRRGCEVKESVRAYFTKKGISYQGLHLEKGYEELRLHTTAATRSSHNTTQVTLSIATSYSVHDLLQRRLAV